MALSLNIYAGVSLFCDSGRVEAAMHLADKLVVLRNQPSIGDVEIAVITLSQKDFVST